MELYCTNCQHNVRADSRSSYCQICFEPTLVPLATWQADIFDSAGIVCRERAKLRFPFVTIVEQVTFQVNYDICRDRWL